MKSILYIFLFSLSFFFNPRSEATEKPACVNACICGNDQDGDGSLNEHEFQEMSEGQKDVPTFAELDDNEDSLIDDQEIEDYPGCKS